MKEQEIEELIGHIGARNCADREHVMQTAAAVNDGLPQWCARRRRIRTALMTALLVVLPTALYVTLPQSEPRQVACNMAGGERQVMDCARNLISIT